jgi:hypothetical protein
MESSHPPIPIDQQSLVAPFSLSSALTKSQVDAASKLHWYLAQASAKSGDNVDEAFTKLAQLILEARKASA